MTTRLTVIAVLVPLVVLGGCDGPPVRERVRIVYLGHDEETGQPDEYTIVEFPDGGRVFRYRHWGKVGDEFTAFRYQGGWR